MDIATLQERVSRDWVDTYSANFAKARELLPHLDAAHGLEHVVKAVGKVTTAIEPADHGGTIDLDALMTGLADLVISAARIANTAQLGGINLQRAVERRLADVAQRNRPEHHQR